jgi:hypothetical protein
MKPLLPRVFGAIDLLAALVVGVGVFVGLPARWWVVDVPAAILVLLLGAAGVGLVLRKPWGERVARVASMVTLALGLLLVGTLAFTASYLSGIYGPVGLGGAVILALVAALALPYLVALPAAQLLWLGPRARADAEASTTAERSAAA